MQNSKKLFQRLNADDSEKFLPDTDYINLENALISQNEFSKNLAVGNIPSSQLLFYYTSALNSLGTVVNYARKRLIWFENNDNSGDDAILCYDLDAKTTYWILRSIQVTDGLGLSTDNRIDRNAKIIGDLLFWTDNLNQPRCINMERGIKLNQPSYVTNVAPYIAPLAQTDITIIVRPPIYRLQIVRMTDAGFAANFTALNAYQFYYRYWWKDYQYSVLSVFSQLVPYNYADETYNSINITMPFTEDVPDLVQQVDFCVRYGNTGKSFIIRSWNKDNPYDLIAIQSHNSNTVQLGFTFYDNVVGIAIDDITANTSFDDVALLAKSLEIARNRLFLANVLKGYDTPSSNSLSISLGTYNTGGAGTYTAQWKYFYLTYQSDTFPYGTGTVQYYYAYQSTIIPTAYYYDAYKFSTSPPGSLNAADATSSWATETQVASYVQNNVAPPIGTHWVHVGYTFTVTGTTLNLVVVVDVGNVQFLKSSSIYKAALTFYDEYRRKTGYTKPVEITIPDRTADQSVFSSIINWTLSNTNAVTEIPDWAYYYMIDVSLSQTTRFFEQIYANNTAYVLKNQDGTFSYTPTTFALNSTYAIGIDLTDLTSKGLGYTFAEGDYCRIYFTDDTNKLIPVIGQDGNFVFLSPLDIGTLGTGVGFLIELYTPFKPSTTEPLYETGDMLPVLNPTEISRTYSTTSGSINGDCYAIERNNGADFYFVEAMSPNDKIWQQWQTDRGWVNFLDTIGQQQKETNIDWSDTYINGTKTNGLSNFQALNTKDIGNTSGEIQKLQLTNKQQEDGSVMLVITTEDSLSAYLSEIQLYKAATVEGLITSSDVIGTINPHQNGQGTINPESVVEYNGTVWWFNALKGIVAQYSNDGVVNISDTKMRRYFDRFSKRYVYLGKAAVKLLCGFSHISACVDITNGIYSLILPQTEVNAVVSGIPVGFAQPLPSYTSLPSYASSIQNRFDIYDGQSKIMNYDYVSNRWVGAFQWLPECMEYVGNRLFGFKDGFLYLMNESTTSWNNIFGTQYPIRLCFTCNLPPSEVKSILNIALESKQIPNFTVVYTNYPDIQISDLTVDDYVNQEGVMYANVYRDRLSPNTTGTVIDKLYQGDVMVGQVGYIMLEFQTYSEQLILNLTNIGFELSRGQSNILKGDK